MIDFFPRREVAVEVLGWPIHWYGILYAVAAVLALILLPRLQRYRDLHESDDTWATVVSVAVLGVLVGGRLGYVLFYEPAYFFANPWEILSVWHGGMSSHGGFVGVAIALGLYLWKRRLPLWKVADVVVVPIAIGLALGRLGNFINEELYGTVTTLPWGIRVPGEIGLRHPTQIYAIAKDLLIAGVCYWHLQAKSPPHGRTAALFLLLYGSLRFLLEFLRDQDYPSLLLGPLALTRGQLLTLPIIVLGIILLAMRRRGRPA